MKARPTIYRGVRMRSRLEAKVAAWLDAQRLRWEYEPDCYGDQDGQYLPDFRLSVVYALGRRRRLYVEVKPAQQGPGEGRPVEVWAELAAMRPIWGSEPDAMLAVCSLHDDAFWRFPLAWQEEGRAHHTRAVWVHCASCGTTGVEDTRDMVEPMDPPECPRRCPAPELEALSPWTSPQYYAARYGRGNAGWST
jgi:hypothetical protein